MAESGINTWKVAWRSPMHVLRLSREPCHMCQNGLHYSLHFILSHISLPLAPSWSVCDKRSLMRASCQHTRLGRSKSTTLHPIVSLYLGSSSTVSCQRRRSISRTPFLTTAFVHTATKSFVGLPKPVQLLPELFDSLSCRGRWFREKVVMSASDFGFHSTVREERRLKLDGSVISRFPVRKILCCVQVRNRLQSSTNFCMAYQERPASARPVLLRPPIDSAASPWCAGPL
jgi:hypothetical protein